MERYRETIFPCLATVCSSHGRCRASVFPLPRHGHPCTAPSGHRGVPGDGFLRQRQSAAPPSRIPTVCYGKRAVPILRARRSRPLLFLPLSAEARARPGRRLRQADDPAGAHLRPRSSGPKRKPRMGTLCLYPLRRSRSGPRKTVSSSCSATLSACVWARGEGCGARASPGRSGGAGAGTDSPGRARAAPHSPSASLLTPPLSLPSPPTPPPRPSPSSLIGQRDKSFCGDGWALTSRAELSHLGIPGAVRMLPAAGSRRRGQQRAGPQPGGGEEHSASRWGDDSGRVSMEIPLGLA
uniref:Uncharacterized protein n=1 Tax=Myotis myotis TaxID=51298 RepID=A0A7J7VYY5_MYOMY|nr:hypothetical protein mMyoMyo1_012210 [Myotis myotis]